LAWRNELDCNGFGRSMRNVDPLSSLAVTHRDGNGLPWMQTDSLARNDELFRESKGTVTKQLRPDYLAEPWTYNSYSSPTQYTGSTGKFTPILADWNTISALPGGKYWVVYGRLQAYPVDLFGHVDGVPYWSDKRLFTIGP
jgi:hypothetical protein